MNTPRTITTFIVLLLVSTLPAASSANGLGRDHDPVVMSGTSLADLIGVAPSAIVAFRYESGWVQIPVQVDERVVKDYGEVYNSTPIGFALTVYADAGTFTGADTDPLFDSDDELVFMTKDAGDDRYFGASDPAGVVPGTGVEVRVTDPVSLQEAWVYLYESAGGLDPSAGMDYVTYTFDLLAGPYLSNYNTMTGPNPENTMVTTSYYGMHFSDRWIRDALNVYAGGATGADLLDRHKNLFGPGNCARSEDTFSAGEGAFFVNKDGAVRAIRSYMGANSGPLTQRDHFFYERRHDVRTILRVHAIQGVMDFYDYSPAASGMTYYNDVNPGGVPVDGSPELPASGAIQWEMVTGAQGTLAYAEMVSTNIPAFTHTSYWLDDATPATTQCTGDNVAYGSSGVWITNPIPNTDPVFVPPPYFDLVFDRVTYPEAPNQTVAFAQTRYAHATQPLLGEVATPTAIALPTPAVLRARNVPNPFSSGTAIVYQWDVAPAGASHASAPDGGPMDARPVVDIYDATGRLVATLRGAGFPGGTVRWDGRDAAGREVASGIYFYRMRLGPASLTRKMVLLR